MTFIKGIIPWNKGKKGLQKNIDTSGLKKGHGWNKGIKNYLSGENHYNWKGGISSIAKRLWNTFEYKQWRSDIFTRDNWTCQTCGVRGISLEAHHIKQLYKILKEYNIKTLDEAKDCEELWDRSNGVSLCRECHKLTFKGKKKYGN
jgi:hypothetical protein